MTPGMQETAIRAEGLGRRYRIGSRVEARLSRRVLAWLRGGFSTRELWAVRGVDLEVARGECVGIAGRNGSGKSTLLRLLAGLLEPTEGTVTVTGTASPFFEIGSGLHWELSVLDNIRLAAALFRMGPRRLRRDLDAIVAFGELEPYLGARLVELSAGYQARVPFSVALHSDVDVLLIDEAFAAGDAGFASRCLERMKGLLAGDRAVVVSSHSMELITGFCDRAIFLEAGRIAREGPPAEIAAHYLERCGPVIP